MESADELLALPHPLKGVPMLSTDLIAMVERAVFVAGAMPDADSARSSRAGQKDPREREIQRIRRINNAAQEAGQR